MYYASSSGIHKEHLLRGGDDCSIIEICIQDTIDAQSFSNHKMVSGLLIVLNLFVSEMIETVTYFPKGSYCFLSAVT
jgi:hypothetical protein